MGSPRLTGLLDSVILIEHLNGYQRATSYLAEQGPHLAISVITRAEVLAGSSEADLPSHRSLLDQFPLLGIEIGRAHV